LHFKVGNKLRVNEQRGISRMRDRDGVNCHSCFATNDFFNLRKARVVRLYIYIFISHNQFYKGTEITKMQAYLYYNYHNKDQTPRA
jgi:hypothetical protein